MPSDVPGHRFRQGLLKKIEAERGSRAILYVTGDRKGWGTQISAGVIDLFADHLDCMGHVDKISLVIYTRGGDSAVAWNLVNLLHLYCKDFEVIAPGKCMSAGTLMALGADRIVMTNQATLGPIDLSLHHPLAPTDTGEKGGARVPVSVEEVTGYLDAIRSCTGGGVVEAEAIRELSGKVHPLVLGQVFRSRQQIRDLAGRLLSKHDGNNRVHRQIIDFLCSESGSHDYTINHREAKNLGLKVEECSEPFYQILRDLRNSYSMQLKLAMDAREEPGKEYKNTRAILESVKYGSHQFISEGATQKVPHPEIPQFDIIKDNRKFDNWRKMT